MKTIYLQRRLSINGRGALGGRGLVDALRECSEELVLAHLVYSQEDAEQVSPELRGDVISETELLDLDADVAIVEGGLFSGSIWKMDEALARKFVNDGGALIVADVDVNILRQQRQQYADLAEFLGGRAAYHGSQPVKGSDETSFWKGPSQIVCRYDDMIVSQWLRPVYDGVPEILAGLPVKLITFGDALASGNQSTTYSEADDLLSEPDSLPFASVYKRGTGFIALICALVTNDVWLERCPHNTRWLTNLAQHLTREAHKEKGRRARTQSRERVFLSHAHEDKPRVKAVYDVLDRELRVGSWLDEQEMVAGDVLPEMIAAAIQEAPVLVLFLSHSALKSMWVQRELDLALRDTKKHVIVVRLDSAGIPERLSNLLRIESEEDSAPEIARAILRAVEKRRRRSSIGDVHARADEVAARRQQAAKVYAEEGTRRRPSPGESLTRAERKVADSIARPGQTSTRLSRPVEVARIRSDYRVDILAFLDGVDLVSGSSRFREPDIENALNLGLIRRLQIVDCQTGMDGHLDDHIATRRHLLYGYEDVRIVDRSLNEIVAKVICEESANVMSAAWSPSGDRVIIGSTNYLTIADDRGHHVVHRSMFHHQTNASPKSVVWQPSDNPLYVTADRICITDRDGYVLRELGPMEGTVVAVAVSPCRRLIAASTLQGRVSVWTESGDSFASFDGIRSEGWHASRCLAFSADSHYLAQCAPHGGDGFLIADLSAGRTCHVDLKASTLVAFHPRRPDILATAAGDTIVFWKLPDVS